MKSKIVIVFFALISFWIIKNRGFDAQRVVNWDKAGYYLYLPAVFIYQDLEDYQFYRDKGKEYNIMGGHENYGLLDLPNGKKLNKYAIGVSVMQLPFFLVAHAYASGSPDYLADGYVRPYMLAIVISNIFWVAAGLLLLRNFLRIYFPENTVFMTVLAIGFGTNLFHYTVYDQGMSHPYSFFLFATVLWLTEKWYADLKTKHLLLLGLTLGLITITRPVNLLVVLVPFLWKVYDAASLKARFSLLINNIREIALAAIIFFLVSLIQMCYWKFVTGNWITYSYGDEGFHFSNPEIINGLFSYRKGWFVYTPIAFLGFIGFVFLWKQYRELVPALVCFFIPMIYITFSWHMWYYGGSFGCRPLIETLPLLAVPLAALFCYFFWIRNYLFKIPFFVLVVFLIALNQFQSYQYALSILHWDSMTKAYYWKVFGRLDVKREDLEHYLKQ